MSVVEPIVHALKEQDPAALMDVYKTLTPESKHMIVQATTTVLGVTIEEITEDSVDNWMLFTAFLMGLDIVAGLCVGWVIVALFATNALTVSLPDTLFENIILPVF